MFIVSDRAMRWWLICVDGIRLYSVGYEITSIEFLGTDQRILSTKAVSRLNETSWVVSANFRSE